MTLSEAAVAGFNRGARSALEGLLCQINNLDDAAKDAVFPDGPLKGVSIRAANDWARDLVKIALTATDPAS